MSKGAWVQERMGPQPLQGSMYVDLHDPNPMSDAEAWTQGHPLKCAWCGKRQKAVVSVSRDRFSCWSCLARWGRVLLHQKKEGPLAMDSSLLSGGQKEAMSDYNQMKRREGGTSNGTTRW